MTRIITCEADLARGLGALRDLDPALHAVIETAGTIPLRLRPPGFVGLAGIVVAQQLSVASARAIWARMEQALIPLMPETIMATDDDGLRACGLSAPKIRTLRAISDAILRGVLPLDALAGMEAVAAHAALVRVKGIGPWTADVYLMFCLGHQDAFAAGDLALQEAARIAYSLEARPDAKSLSALAERWTPWRSVAARLLWSYYAAVKRRDGAPLASG